MTNLTLSLYKIFLKEIKFSNINESRKLLIKKELRNKIILNKNLKGIPLSKSIDGMIFNLKYITTNKNNIYIKRKIINMITL